MNAHSSCLGEENTKENKKGCYLQCPEHLGLFTIALINLIYA